jgi:NADH-quinone oxidoreductase subunit L
MEAALVLIPVLLLAGAAVNAAVSVARARGVRVDDRLVSASGVLAPVLAFLASVRVVGDVDHTPDRYLSVRLFDWFGAGGLDAGFKLSADHLTCVMLLVVTGVGSVIHIYSLGYMKGDPGYARYFACLNLFTFFMSLLVLAGDLLVLFVGWEGVGLCSYLLIGFWWTDEVKAAAGMKAFVVNRIGDAGFLLGMLLLWSTAGTLDFRALQAFMGTEAGREAMLGASGIFGVTVATLAGCLLFLGATGKSAQIPLYVWLPDAMAGPTPVSALIHAATMVTAGVYMVARMNFLYALSPFGQGVICVVAGLTCLLAALMAMTQHDIKKVLAYSTISQIGYMMIGVGTGFVGAGMFHVVTHAFFKGALFLGAGSIITMCHHEQDLRHMGGLGRKMPWTCAAMTVSAAAMAGIPPLSGFFSKDEVLWRAFSADTLPATLSWIFGFLAAGCTGFYMFRLIFLAFAGSYRGHAHPAEAPLSMTLTQGALAAGAMVIGFLGVPHLLGGHDFFGHYVSAVVPAWAAPKEAAHPAGGLAVEWSLMVWSVMVGVAGISAAWWFYIRRKDLPEKLRARFGRAHHLVHGKFFVDEAYMSGIVSPVESAAESFFHRKVDLGLIDGLINGLGRLFRSLGSALSRVQGGFVRSYVAVMVAGLLLLLLTLLS